MSGGCSEALEDRKHFTREDEIRRAALARGDFDILPTDPASPPRLQRFQSRFFRREPRRIMLRGDDAATVAVIAFGAREHAFGKAGRSQQHFANPRNFDNVYTDGNDHN